MGFRPLHDWALIRRDEPSGKTAGGIIIPDTAKDKPAEGVVLAIGPGKFKKEHGKKEKEKKFVPTVLQPGQRVMFIDYMAKDVELGAGTITLIREDDILGTIEGVREVAVRPDYAVEAKQDRPPMVQQAPAEPATAAPVRKAPAAAAKPAKAAPKKAAVKKPAAKTASRAAVKKKVSSKAEKPARAGGKSAAKASKKTPKAVAKKTAGKRPAAAKTAKKKSAPKKAAPRKTEPRKAASKKTAPKKAAPGRSQKKATVRKPAKKAVATRGKKKR